MDTESKVTDTGETKDASIGVLGEWNAGLRGEDSPYRAGGSRVRMDQPGASCAGIGAGWGMVVRSAQVRKVLKTISRLSPYKATVLINGESGTGKELVARALHTLGPVPG